MSNDIPDWSNSVYQPDVPVSPSTIAYVNGSVSVTVTIPNGVHILSIVLPGFPNVGLLTVQGVQSGAHYLSEAPQFSIYTDQYYCFVPQLVDTQVTVTINAGAAGTAYLSGILAPIAVAAMPQNPAPWQAPNRPPLGFSFSNPGAGNAVTILAAPINAQSIWLHSMSWIWTVAGATGGGNFQDTSGQIALKDVPVVAGQARFQDFKGAKMTGGDAFEFLQVGALAAGTTFFEGSITYSVY